MDRGWEVSVLMEVKGHLSLGYPHWPWEFVQLNIGCLLMRMMKEKSLIWSYSRVHFVINFDSGLRIKKNTRLKMLM